MAPLAPQGPQMGDMLQTLGLAPFHNHVSQALSLYLYILLVSLKSPDEYSRCNRISRLSGLKQPKCVLSVLEARVGYQFHWTEIKVWSGCAPSEAQRQTAFLASCRFW